MFLTRGLDIDCNELVELVTAYLDDALDPDTRRRFTDHLDLCDGCGTYVEQMRQTVRLTGALASDDLTPDLRETLLTAFRGWKNGTAPPA
ncbi:anti-sigma factor [Frankia sp. AgPm24]|uniref:anti-sigma factor family protein n=1 Tax=Frankia sp. AgPm24 TaxID=631128 RepID=UPI00200EBC30|nr:anti-sigma factor [Frankia sp. AgPm24]MCK9923917.1 anti-sigma factor [Frankia sp. AgPm24]